MSSAPTVRAHHDPFATNVGASVGRFPLDFFALVFALSAPIWLLGGKNKLPLPVPLPVSALTTFIPALAASILCYRHSGTKGVRTLWRRVLDFRRIRHRRWLLPVLFLAPSIHAIAYGIMRATGMPLPDSVEIPLASVPGLAVMFFISDTGEELGWMGYAADPMQSRYGALRASLIFGVLYALWHVVPYVQTGNAPDWIIWQSVYSVAQRVLFMWLYNHTGKSVFAAIVFHITVNISWTLFPNGGSHYHPALPGILTVIAALLVATSRSMRGRYTTDNGNVVREL